MRKYLLSAASAAGLAFAAPSYAAAVITAVGSDDPNVIVDDSNGPATKTVHYTADGLYADNTVYGTIAGSPGAQMVITSDEFIQPSSDGNGQAWIIGTDAAGQPADDTAPGLHYLDYALAGGYTFGSIEFNLNTFRTTGKPVGWSVDVFSFASGGLLEQTHLEGITNSTFISVYTTGATRLSHVAFNTFGAPQIQGVGQLRIGGVQAVPEPATWAMMLLGFGGVGALLRRSRRVARLIAANLRTS